MSDVSKNPINPNIYNSKDIYEKLDMDNVKEHLKDQHTLVSATSKWATIDEEELLRIFKVNDMPRKMTEDDLKQKVLETFNQDTDPLSVESLKKKFKNFPDEWYDYMSKSANDKITLIKEEEQVKKNNGEFNISFK
jgi:hypothetical protein